MIVGGGYSLSALVALILNTRALYHGQLEGDPPGIRADVKENLIMLIPSALVFAAGMGIHKQRRWGLVLTGAMSFLAVGFGIHENLKFYGKIFAPDPSLLTIVLPMAAIAAWTVWPGTWVQFEKARV
jgi:hypothetical protein